MRTPKLQFHSASGRYRVSVKGKDFWLGRDKAEAEKRYHLMMADYVASGTIIQREPGEPLSVAELIEYYLNDREKYHANRPESFHRGRIAMRYLFQGFAHYTIDQFGMNELRRLRENIMAPHGDNKRQHCRSEVNRYMQEIVRMLRWCVSMELCPADLYAKAETLEPLKKGRTDAPESDPVTSVDIDHVRAVQAIVARPVADMIELQLLTGARSGEICGLTSSSIDRSGPVWVAELEEHKTAHLDKSRRLCFGPKAQAVLKPYLLKGGELFDYTPRSYQRAISRACKRAGVQHWHPHQLRHTAATEMRKQYGAEVTRAVLGHSNLKTTEIYAEVDRDMAVKVAGEIG